MEKASPSAAQAVHPVARVIPLKEEEKDNITKDDLMTKYKELESHVTQLEEHASKDVDEKLKLQQQESTRRENVLVMRLATKEQEMQELLTQIQELKQAQTPSTTQLQTMLIDPAVNLLFEKMKTELTETKDRLEQAQNDLSAWKFTPDSVTGKKLMGKCRMLIQENQDLGKQLSQGRIAQLEAELSLQKKYSEELKGSQDEMNEFVIQLDEEVEGMQATICALQQQLKEAKLHSDKLVEENKSLLKRQGEETPPQTTLHTTNGESNELHTLTNHESTELTNLPENHELKKSIEDQEMEIDSSIQDSLKPSRTVNNDGDQFENHHLNNQVTVIRGKDLESQMQQYLNPNKGLTKTSFSITDLLSTNSIKKESDVSMDETAEFKTEENGEHGLLNGEIDDAAI